MKTKVHKAMTNEMINILSPFFKSTFETKVNGQKMIDLIATGSYIEDSMASTFAKIGDKRTPWVEHFWQQNLGSVGLTIDAAFGGGLGDNVKYMNRAAYLRATDYWSDYVLGKNKFWKDKSAVEKEEALIFLGRIIHLLQDMSTPAHTNNDMHIGNGNKGWLNYYDDDDLEDYVETQIKKVEGDYVLPNKYKVSQNLKFFNAVNWNIHKFFKELASQTMKYDSDDVDGIGDGLPYRFPIYTVDEYEGHHSFRDGVHDLTDFACDIVAKNLIPLSFSFGASLLIKFLYDLKILNSGSIMNYNEEVELNIELSNVEVFNKSKYGVDVILKTLNGSINKHIKKNKIPYFNSNKKAIDLGKRIIKKGEAIKICIEAFEDDMTLDDFMGRTVFEISYNDIKNGINKNKKIIFSNKKENNKGIEAEIKITATSKASAIFNNEKCSKLEFYSVDIKSLDKEEGGEIKLPFGQVVYPLGKDDIAVHNFFETTDSTILSSCEVMDLIEIDVLSSDDEVNNFRWKEWKEWIGKKNKIVNVKIAGSKKPHRISLNIKKYKEPSKPSKIEFRKYNVNMFLHSIERPRGNNKYDTIFIKKKSENSTIVYKDGHLEFELLTDNGVNKAIVVPNDEWTRWINDGKGLKSIKIGDNIYNLIFKLKAIEPEYSITSYLDKIYVINDEDTDIYTYIPFYGKKLLIEDCGEVHAKYVVDGKQKNKFYLGTICSKDSKKVSKLLGNKDIYKKNDSIKFKIKVYDDDDGLLSNDSMGTVTVDIPYNTWRNWKNKENGHITKYYKSSNGDCKLAFKFIIKEVDYASHFKTLSTFSKKAIVNSISKSPNPSQLPISEIDRSLVIKIPDNVFVNKRIDIDPKLLKANIIDAFKALPEYGDVKKRLETPLIDEKKIQSITNDIYFYNDTHSSRIVLHKKGCHLLTNDKSKKRLYLYKSDIQRIKHTKANLLHPDNTLNELEKDYHSLISKLAHNHIADLKTRGVINDDSKVEKVRQFFIFKLKMDKQPKKYTKTDGVQEIINHLSINEKPSKKKKYQYILDTDVLNGKLKVMFIEKKINKMKEFVNRSSKKNKEELFYFKSKIKNSVFCPYCNRYH